MVIFSLKDCYPVLELREIKVIKVAVISRLQHALCEKFLWLFVFIYILRSTVYKRHYRYVRMSVKLRAEMYLVHPFCFGFLAR